MIIDEQFHMLRVLLEKNYTAPLVLGVISAETDDGSSYVASCLAIAFAQAGHETVVLDVTAAPTKYSVDGISAVSRLAPVSGEPRLFTALAASPRSNGRLDVRASCDSLATKFSVTVINAAGVPNSSAALESAELATALVIAIKFGRRSSSADKTLMTLLADRSADIVGVVPTLPSARIDLLSRATMEVKSMVTKNSTVDNAVELFG